MEKETKNSVETYVEYVESKMELNNLIHINLELNKLKEKIIIAFNNNNEQYITMIKGSISLRGENNEENIPEGIIFTKDSLPDFDKKIEENKLRMIEIINK